jgi:hypothetical protein
MGRPGVVARNEANDLGREIAKKMFSAYRGEIDDAAKEVSKWHKNLYHMNDGELYDECFDLVLQVIIRELGGKRKFL